MGKRVSSPARKQYLSWVVSETRRKLKVRAVEYKGGKCLLCGYHKCLAALQFHHLEEDGKDFQIGGQVRSWEALKLELDKTIMVCANCHAEIHAEGADTARAAQEVAVRKLIPVRVPAPHGASRYQTGCRCAVCKAGHAARVREFKASKRP
jgi:hypothetical protein